jgi:branched-chain amino acid transport system ATP-binding protein
MAEPLLRVAGLSKAYGGLVANSAIDLDLAPNQIHALIGPNGAGKTTLVAQLAGEVTPSAGTIRFRGRDITRLPPHRRSALGLARTFQVTSIFGSLTALENVALAAQAHDGHSFRFWTPADRIAHLNERACAMLARVGLLERADTLCTKLAHGEHRQLEIAMALATRPQALLLDEPTAGMSPQESQQITRLLLDLKRDHAILLVEHDMDMVFAVADRLSVLVYGRVLACGTPTEIRANPEVRAAYLGN